jgi:formyltetrahydrofolate synthetase
MNKDFQEKLQDLAELLRVQEKAITVNSDPYMQGLYNGLELAMSVMEERDPNFKVVMLKEGAEEEVDKKIEQLGESIKDNLEQIKDGLKK